MTIAIGFAKRFWTKSRLGKTVVDSHSDGENGLLDGRDFDETRKMSRNQTTTGRRFRLYPTRKSARKPFGDRFGPTGNFFVLPPESPRFNVT